MLIMPCLSACLTLIISPISPSHPHSPSSLCVGLIACLTLSICLTYSHRVTLSSLQSVFFFVCRFAHLLDSVSLICSQMTCLSAYVTLIIIMTLSSPQSVWFVCRSDRLLDFVSLICSQMSCLSAYVTLIIIITLSSGFRTHAPKMYLRLFLFLFFGYLPFFPFLVCLLFLTTIMNKGNRGGFLK